MERRALLGISAGGWLQPSDARRSRSSLHGFTMIEIAIAIAVIGFALVAIIGILPRGMQVQRDNRSETILNQDGTFWLEAIRNGAQGLNELPRHVTRIDVKDENGANIGGSPYTTFGSGADIIGLLTTQAVVTNAHVTAQVYAISGAASEKALNTEEQELAFRYLLRVQIHQSTNTALSFLESTSTVATNEPLATLYDLKVELGYPLGSGNQPPRRKLAFRSLVSRNWIGLSRNDGATNYFFVP
jgi:prepilin-type N-terminal cleavage/methylation domain-containing protein